ncbi:MAG: glycine--tRNA ligase [Alphaproteobacteria bacterium]|nr:glycine--tRNA ligase [Alphaproteobacteria bacterium]
MAQPETPLMNRIVSLAKRRGFIYQASEIYGGLNGFWDFGPLGSQLKNNLRDAWWHSMVECPPMGPDGKPMTIVGLDSCIIQHPTTWHASGHVGGFADMMVDCRETKLRYRADHVLCIDVYYEKGGAKKLLGLLSALDGDEPEETLTKKAKKMIQKAGGGELLPIDMGQAVPLTSLDESRRAGIIGPDTETPGTLTEPRAFNLMFHSYVGALQDEDSKVYLRPETAQGIFLQYKNVLDTSRVKIPFGVAQVGRSFRNEVTPRNFVFRAREFEQMEMEFFCAPDEGFMWYEFWVAERMRWWENQGVKKENLFRHIIPAEELSHYSKGTSDIEYRWPFTAPGFGELEGVAYRTDYDLTQHQKFSKVNLEYFDQETKQRYMPHVVEPASGLTRGVLLLLAEGYQYDESRPSPEWLKIKPSLAPVKVGIFPLVNKDGMPEVAEKLYMDLRGDFMCQFDAKQSIGKRYARMDECGTPFCVTVDGETLKDQKVTIRDRDTAQQERIALDKVREYVSGKLGR